MTTWHREWCSTVKGRRGRMVTLEALETLLKLRDPGYASVYMFDETAAAEITERGHSQGLKEYAVAADCLTLDIDSGDAGLLKVAERLASLDIYAEIWRSGGKGYHVVIPHAPVHSKDLPYSHKKLVESWGLQDVVDTTLYQHGRLLSLPGRVHPVTKRKKEHVGHNGMYQREITIPIVQEPRTAFTFDIRNDLDLLAIGLMRMTDLINMPPKLGGRHTATWGAAKDLADSGLSYETVLDIALRINETWQHQKTEEEIEAAVRQAFQNTR